MKYIGIDNGVSGSIAILDEMGDVLHFGAIPTATSLNYTKKKAFLRRIDHMKLGQLLEIYVVAYDCKCAIERPMVNPKRFQATTSALRALESTLIVLENLKIPFRFIDSKEWQRAMLPAGLKGDELKIASNQVCQRTFPGVMLKKMGDGDGLLIAEYLRKQEIGGTR